MNGEIDRQFLFLTYKRDLKVALEALILSRLEKIKTSFINVLYHVKAEDTNKLMGLLDMYTETADCFCNDIADRLDKEYKEAREAREAKEASEAILFSQTKLI